LSAQFKSGQKRITATFLRFPFLISFGVLTILNLWFALHDRTTPYFNGVSAIASPTQAAKAWGWSDSGSYLQMGISQAKFGHLTDDLMWTAIFWPPGMSYLNVFAIKMVGLEGQFIFVMATLTALLWGLVMTLIFNILRSFMRVWIAILVIAILIQTDLYHQYLVRDAVIWSDGYAAAFICLTILFSYIGYSKSRIRYFVLSGFSLAVVAHIRGQYFLVVQFFVVLAVCLVGLYVVSFVYNKVKVLPDFSKNPHDVLKLVTMPLAILSIAAMLTCTPYLLWQKNHIGDLSWDLKGEWHWTSNDAFAVMFNWHKNEDLAGFIRDGGGGTACKVDPQLCAEINLAEYKNASPFSIYDSEPYTAKEFYDLGLRTFLHHPVKWFTIKFPYLLRYWNSKPSIASPSGSDFPNSVLSAFGLLILGASFFARRTRKLWFGPAFIAVVLTGATLAPAYLAHFEVRYLVAVKFIGLCVSCGALGFGLNQGLKKFLSP
jgi:hypothetical protein